MQRTIRIVAASLGFVPMIIVLLATVIALPEWIAEPALFLNLPAVMLAGLVDTFNVSESVKMVSLVVAMLLWSSVLAIVLWKFAAMFLGEDEPNGRKFDWEGFWIRFVCGFVVGFLLGWRFAKNSSTKTILICMTVTGIFCGLLLGAWRENFWRRPL